MNPSRFGLGRYPGQEGPETKERGQKGYRMKTMGNQKPVLSVNVINLGSKLTSLRQETFRPRRLLKKSVHSRSML
jgi:hypothetical protein